MIKDKVQRKLLGLRLEGQVKAALPVLFAISDKHCVLIKGRVTRLKNVECA